MKKLLLTLATGTHGKYWDLVSGLMKSYAVSCDADCEVITTPTDSTANPCFGKYKLKDYFSVYERILYLDIDILVRSDSPNLFDIVPLGHFAALNEGSICSEEDWVIRVEHVKRIGLECRATDCDLVPYDYFNAGVVLLDRADSEVFALPISWTQTIMAEQSYMNINILRLKPRLYHLPMCFNAMPWRWSHDYLKSNYFIHYAGMDDEPRYRRMTEDITKI